MTTTLDDDVVDVPQVYKHHIFACFTQRPPNHPRGSCGAVGAQPLWDYLSKALEAEHLSDVGFTAAGCLGFCRTGPLMVVYPEGIWYRPSTAEDIDEIVQSHFKQGKRVDRLVMVLSKN
ncbi:ferredoxin [Hyphomicrobium sp. MC1]|uniref:(2Fe-2S) ferredoxin domain-containing protein n=1 Tax=Hyphomicrobium sp. (strain MC1) TaxID=717785 RepID=UPI000213D3D4|nr:(2Fe-2S) ferredoxin domain-containing protein [Hyphomicrobium sp. MC1]CCB66857.1 Ferredoxin, 2Fe-2S (AaFd4) [Hyphomicrobium sp. MC1]